MSTEKPDRPLSTKEMQTALGATLDILRALVLKNQFGCICARGGWTIEMSFLEGDTLPVRQRAWQVLDSFVEAVGAEKLAIWREGAPAALQSKMGQTQWAKARERSQGDPKARAMMFNLASGNPKPPEQWENNVQDFRLSCWINNSEGLRIRDPRMPDAGPHMSFIRMHLPVSWVVDQSPERGAGALTARLVELMQPLWCIAGWGVMPAVEERNIDPDGKGQQMLYPFLQRFPGLNALGDIALLGPAFNNAMPSVNWLNYVSDPLLDQLGGREAVRQQAQAGKYLSVGNVGNCLGIRAGDFPALGDTQHGITLPAFGEAARLLKPIRAKSYWNNFVAPPPSGSNDRDAWRLACDAYLSRFDLF